MISETLRTYGRVWLLLLAAVVAGCAGAPPRPALQAQAIAADRDARRALQAGDLLRAQQRFGKALALQQALDDTAAAALTRINLGTLAHRLRQDADALGWLDSVLQETPGVYPADSVRLARFRKAVMLVDLGRWQEGEGLLQEAALACGSCPLQPGMDLLQARILWLRGDIAGALALAQAVATRSQAGAEEHANALRLQAMAEERLGQPDAALAHYAAALAGDKALGLSARIAEDLQGMARTARQCGREQDAERYARRSALAGGGRE